MLLPKIFLLAGLAHTAAAWTLEFKVPANTAGGCQKSQLYPGARYGLSYGGQPDLLLSVYDTKHVISAHYEGGSLNTVYQATLSGFYSFCFTNPNDADVDVVLTITPQSADCSKTNCRGGGRDGT